MFLCFGVKKKYARKVTPSNRKKRYAGRKVVNNRQAWIVDKMCAYARLKYFQKRAILRIFAGGNKPIRTYD